MDRPADFIALFDKLIAGACTPSEKDRLLQWLGNDQADEEAVEWLDTYFNTPIQNIEIDPVVQEALNRRLQAITSGNQIPGVRRLHFLKTAWFRSAAAALLILFISAAVYVWNTQKQNSPLVQIAPVPVQNDIPAPSLSRATLTLAGGQQIFVDSAMNGMLATQGNVNIQKMNDGRIVYNGKAEAGEIQYNTLTVPRGSQIASIVLADGSKVFLNAASSLKYPVSFHGNERRVEITGEAYFEVAKDPAKKFIVNGGAITTEVLGTHFNINTYTDEDAAKVTLLEGSVKVTGGASGLVIKPGGQAAFAKGVFQLNPSVNTEQVMAWKNGEFIFEENATIEDIMRPITRWYDVEVEYKGKVEKHFWGSIPRNVKLAQVLKVLEGTGGATFKIDHQKIIVMP